MLARQEIDGFITKYKMLEARGWSMNVKGQTWLSSSFVYAPYVPLNLTPVIYEPKNFTPRTSVMSSYGNTVLSRSFYGTVDLSTGAVFTRSGSIDKK